MRQRQGMLLLAVLLGLAGSTYGEEPAPDAYDTAIARFCQATGQQVRQKQDVRGGPVLEDIKGKLGASLLRYRQYMFLREKINVLTYQDSAGAIDGVNKIRALAGARSIVFAHDVTLVEIVYTDLRDGVHLCGYLQDSEALKSTARAARRGVNLVKVIRAQEADVLRISQSLNMELLEIVNCWCTINGRALQLNFLRPQQALKPDDVRARFVTLGAQGERLLVVDDMVVEMVGKDVTEADVDATRRVLVPSALSVFLDRIAVAHGQIVGVSYPPLMSYEHVRGLKAAVVNVAEVTLVLDNKKTPCVFMLAECKAASPPATGQIDGMESIPGYPALLIKYIEDPNGKGKQFIAECSRQATTATTTPGVPKASD